MWGTWILDSSTNDWAYVQQKYKQCFSCNSPYIPRPTERNRCTKIKKQSCRQNHSKCDLTIECLSKIDRTKNTYKDAWRCFKLESLYRKLFLSPGKVIYHDVKADAVNLAGYCLLNDSRNRRNHNRTQSLFICLGWEKIRVRLRRAGTHGKGRHDTLTKPYFSLIPPTPNTHKYRLGTSLQRYYR